MSLKNVETTTNVGITDQSKCVLGEKKLLGEDFTFAEVTSDMTTNFPFQHYRLLILILKKNRLTILRASLMYLVLYQMKP